MQQCCVCCGVICMNGRVASLRLSVIKYSFRNENRVNRCIEEIHFSNETDASKGYRTQKQHFSFNFRQEDLAIIFLNSFYMQKYCYYRTCYRGLQRLLSYFIFLQSCVQNKMLPLRVLCILLPYDVFYSKLPGSRKLISVTRKMSKKKNFFQLEWQIMLSCHFSVPPSSTIPCCYLCLHHHV